MGASRVSRIPWVARFPHVSEHALDPSDISTGNSYSDARNHHAPCVCRAHSGEPSLSRSPWGFSPDDRNSQGRSLLFDPRFSFPDGGKIAGGWSAVLSCGRHKRRSVVIVLRLDPGQQPVVRHRSRLSMLHRTIWVRSAVMDRHYCASRSSTSCISRLSRGRETAARYLISGASAQHIRLLLFGKRIVVTGRRSTSLAQWLIRWMRFSSNCDATSATMHNSLTRRGASR
jgi:hypothetical protein